MNDSLAIIIPAYKSIFLKETLKSLANQTNKNFTLYIGDDNSPEDLLSIVNDFKDLLDIKYTKFENNIGAKNLVNQWNRCIKLVQNEDWIWLFSDDDIADKNCVETFYKTILDDNKKYDVYRFNTRVINDNGDIIAENESPFQETSLEMTKAILKLERGHCMPDHIFNKKKYNELGGFVFTNYAQAADWATSISFAGDKGICSMKNAKISWRYGDYNISGTAYKNNHDKLLGHIQFLNWVIQYFEPLKQRDIKSFKELQKLVYYNLIEIVKIHYKGISFKSFIPVFVLLQKNKNKKHALIATLKLIRFR